MGLNDSQCACKGNWGRDVSYAITTSLTTENRRAWEQESPPPLPRVARGGGRTESEVRRCLDYLSSTTFSALAWWTGTLGQPPDAPIMQPRESSIEFIGRMTRAIDDLDALRSFSAK